MVEKLLILNKEEFATFRKTRWKNERYRTFNVLTVPSSYPCVALEVTTSEAGVLEEVITIEAYVYLGDFPIGERNL